jgi:hypothetical protein
VTLARVARTFGVSYSRLRPSPRVVTTSSASARWPGWARVAFRFAFVYVVLYAAPWQWLGFIPGVSTGLDLGSRLDDWAVRAANARFFHVREHLVAPNGSGDTSWAWARLWLYLSIAGVATAAWSIVDRGRTAYPTLLYWLRTGLRYYLASYALGYGIIKLFLLQMPFPTLSQLATPLGEFLPMRLSWMFIGYSPLYQFFSGLAETSAGLLLLVRRTTTLGLLAAAGAFLNVVMINLAYDVPVKLFALHLLAFSVVMLLLDGSRLARLLVLNQPVERTSAYDPIDARPWHRYARWTAKAYLVYFFLVSPFNTSWRRYQTIARTPPSTPFAAGVYDVQHFVLNGDTLRVGVRDALRWREVIIDNAGQGSIGTADSLFWQRYGRGYFRYSTDTSARTVAVWKTSTVPGDSTWLFAMRYEVPDSTRIRWWGKVRDDSLHVELVRTPRHFPLTERQFHWLSEYNR